MLIQGYHPGLEDDAFYLAAIKRDLNPALFPHDADFFRIQFQATIFDRLIAWSVRLAHIPLAWGVLLWQFASIVLILWACLQIARRCFAETHAQWAAVATVAALLTIPVSGTAISLTDQYLHPRALATGLVLCAIAAVLEERRWMAGWLLGLALVIHAIQASFGISFCVFLAWKRRKVVSRQMAALLLPLAWIFEPASDSWRQAAATRTFYFLGSWHWYDWLGVFAPLLLLWCFRRLGERKGSAAMSQFASRLLYFGIFQTAVGLLIMLPPAFERLRPLEPMRYLQLVYILFFLLAGGLAGQYILGKHLYRWLLLFVPLGLGMFYAQRQMYPASNHLELPGVISKNSWVEAFTWVRDHTATDSLFALDPHYMELPGEDFHGFRALAERSVLADSVKDAGMAARVPELAPRWQREVEATTGLQHFRGSDFQKLKSEFGVTWVVLAKPPVSNGQSEQNEQMNCPYRNEQVSVCRID